MRALQLSQDGKTVINIIALEAGADPAEFGAVAAPHDGVGIGWTLSGDEWVAPVVVASPAEIKRALAAAVQAHVQATARGRGYDSGEACASYVASTNASWAAEAAAFVAWRDDVWASALAMLAALESGAEVAPTADMLIAGLPVIEWPDVTA